MTLLDSQIEAVDNAMPYRVVGQVVGISGLTIEATNLPLPIGSMCRITSFGGKTSDAEIIGFKDGITLLMALSAVSGIARGDAIENVTAAPRIWCCEDLLGRVINGFGVPIDNKGPLPMGESRRIDGRGAMPLDRVNIREAISTSVRAID